jgi:hypothetical protein
VAWVSPSDCRDKTRIESLPDNLGLRFIKKLRPVGFHLDNREDYWLRCKYKYGQKDGTLVSEKQHYGLIAQEIKQVIDELNVKFDALGHDPEMDAYRLAYEELIAPIIKSVQEVDDRLLNIEKILGLIPDNDNEDNI